MRLLSLCFGLVMLVTPGPAAQAEEKPSSPPRPVPLAAPPASTSVRVVILYGDELLKSEARNVADLQKRLSGKPQAKVAVSEGSPAEKAVAAAWLGAAAPSTPPAWPAEWKDAATVFVLNVLPPEGKKPSRVSNGIGGRLIFRAPTLAPIYLERTVGKSGLPLSAERLAKWVDGFLALSQKVEAK